MGTLEILVKEKGGNLRYNGIKFNGKKIGLTKLLSQFKRQSDKLTNERLDRLGYGWYERHLTARGLYDKDEVAATAYEKAFTHELTTENPEHLKEATDLLAEKVGEIKSTYKKRGSYIKATSATSGILGSTALAAVVHPVAGLACGLLSIYGFFKGFSMSKAESATSFQYHTLKDEDAFYEPSWSWASPSDTAL